MFRNLTQIIVAVAIASILAGCESSGNFIQGNTSSNSNSSAKGSVSPFNQFPNIPIPVGSKINVDKTLVFGSKPWYGQLVFKSSGNINQLFDFYRENLPQYGWQEVTSVRAPTSILTYSSPERVLAIAIQSATLTGSDITVTASPRGEVSPPPAPTKPAPIKN